MLQRTKDGKLYATVRIHLMNWVQRSKEQGPFIKVLQKDGEFKQVEATEQKLTLNNIKIAMLIIDSKYQMKTS